MSQPARKGKDAGSAIIACRLIRPRLTEVQHEVLHGRLGKSTLPTYQGSKVPAATVLQDEINMSLSFLPEPTPAAARMIGRLGQVLWWEIVHLEATSPSAWLELVALPQLQIISTGYARQVILRAF